ncbi:MAG: N-formylglutamate amidohydrolase [Burkholderiaceae bacterium]
MRAAILITCEHGGHRVPAEYRSRFEGLGNILASHRGFDAGSLVMARDLARALNAPLVYSTITRLLIDLNRSIGHRSVFSEVTASLPAHERARIVHSWYRPYRDEVEARVRAAAARGKIIVHLSSHSFTPVLAGEIRSTDIGLLYDPARPGEAGLARLWQRALTDIAPHLRVRRNYPYRGYNDGLTTHLRSIFSSASYIGIELEVNQALMGAHAGSWRAVRRAVIDALRIALPTMMRTARKNP